MCVLLQVCDSILNIGPCANASMGEPAFLSEEVQTFEAPRVSVDWLVLLMLQQRIVLEVADSDVLLPTVPK